MSLFGEAVNTQAIFTGLGTLAALLAGSAGWLMFRPKSDAVERERRRREMVARRGRTGDANIIEATEELIQYSYSVGGVDYLASQDVSTLRNLLPEDVSALIGPATLKYLASNPANSIVVSENWSGLRVPHLPAEAR